MKLIYDLLSCRTGVSVIFEHAENKRKEYGVLVVFHEISEEFFLPSSYCIFVDRVAGMSITSLLPEGCQLRESVSVKRGEHFCKDAPEGPNISSAVARLMI